MHNKTETNFHKIFIDGITIIIEYFFFFGNKRSTNEKNGIFLVRVGGITFCLIGVQS